VLLPKRNPDNCNIIFLKNFSYLFFGAYPMHQFWNLRQFLFYQTLECFGFLKAQNLQDGQFALLGASNGTKIDH
jgi:hypothetical protein